MMCCVVLWGDVLCRVVVCCAPPIGFLGVFVLVVDGGGQPRSAARPRRRTHHRPYDHAHGTPRYARHQADEQTRARAH